MNKDKARKILQALEPVDTKLEEALKTASRQIKDSLESKTLEQSKRGLRKLDEKILSVFQSLDDLKQKISSRDSSIQEIRTLFEAFGGEIDSLRDELVSLKNQDISSQIKSLSDKINSIPKIELGKIQTEIKESIYNLENYILSILAQEEAINKADLDDLIKDLEERLKKDFQERLSRNGTEMMSRLGGGGIGASNNIRSGTFGFTIGDGSTVLTTGQKGYIRLPFYGTITGWSIVASGTNPTCTIDVWKIASGTSLPTVSNTIMGTKPALATGNAIASTTLTNWTTAISTNDIVGFNLDAVSAATSINFVITYIKS